MAEKADFVSNRKEPAMKKRIVPPTYVPPTQVMSPRRHWTLVAVLIDEEEGKEAAAIGRWDGKPVLVMRWNGNADNPIGNPQSRGLPTWFVVPERFREPILTKIREDKPDKKALVDGFFAEQ
jgi:hypothetical protein